MAAPDASRPQRAEPAPVATPHSASRARWLRGLAALAIGAAGAFTAYAGALVLATSRAVERGSDSVATVLVVGGVLLLCALVEGVVAYRVARARSLGSVWLAAVATVASLAGLGLALAGILPYRILFWAWLASALVLAAFARARRTVPR